eukprot:2709906-Prorocentrum_lima.AAC.1
MELPFHRTLFDDGDVDRVTEAWVLVTHFEEGRALVEASATPNTLEAAGPAGCRVQWLHSTFGAALSAIRCGLVLAHEDAGAGGAL